MPRYLETIIDPNIFCDCEMHNYKQNRICKLKNTCKDFIFNKKNTY